MAGVVPFIEMVEMGVEGLEESGILGAMPPPPLELSPAGAMGPPQFSGLAPGMEVNLFNWQTGRSQFSGVRQEPTANMRLQARLNAFVHAHSPDVPGGGGSGVAHLINFSRQQSPLEFSDKMPYGRGVPGLPVKRKVTHRFCSPNGQMTFNSNAPVVIRNTVLANDLKDPGNDLGAGVITNGGGAVADAHDPLLREQLAAVYDRYVVLKTRIRVDFFNAEGGGAVDPAALIVGVALKDDATVLPELGRYQENGYSKWAALGPEGVTTVMYGVDVPKFFGSSAPSSDSTLLTTFGTAPTNALFFHIFAHPIDNSINAAAAYSLNFTVYVEYDVLWLEPKDVDRSS